MTMKGILYSLIVVMVLLRGVRSKDLSNPSLNEEEKRWCVAKNGADDAALLDAIDYVCGNMRIDCSPIKEGGICYLPPTLLNHASFVMNRYYQSRGRHEWNCDFNHNGIITITDPSYGSCIYDRAT